MDVEQIFENGINEEAHIPWPDPTAEMLASPEFNAIWECIKDWDIQVPRAYGGYCGATGNHVRAILDSLKIIGALRGRVSDLRTALFGALRAHGTSEHPDQRSRFIDAGWKAYNETSQEIK